MTLSLAASGCTSGGDGEQRADSDLTVVAPQACDVSGCVGEGVDTATGSYTFSTEDLLFPSGVFGLTLVRSYRSDRLEPGLFGRGWSTIYETKLTLGASGARIDAPAGLAPLWEPEAPEGWAIAGGIALRNDTAGTALVWPSGESWLFASDGSLTSIASPYGQTLAIKRLNGVVASIESSQGPTIAFETENGLLTTARTDDGREALYTYNGERLVRSEAPGVSLAYRYNADGRMIQLDGPSGTTTTSYAEGTVASQTTATGQRLTLTYDGRTAEVATDQTLAYEHDAEGRLTKVVEGERQLERRRFDKAGRLVEASRYAFPGNAVVEEVERTYDQERLVSEVHNGVTTEFDYDDNGRLVARRAGPASVTFEYSGGNPLPTSTATSARGREQYGYTDGLVTRVEDATGAAMQIGRDRTGNPTSRSNADLAPWRYAFDAEGNVVATTSPSGRTWTATWAPRARLVSETDPLGRVSTFERDDAGRVTAQYVAGALDVSYRYDELGRLSEETKPGGLITKYRYDASGRLSQVDLPGEVVWRSDTTRDVAGALTTTVEAPDGTRSVSIIDSAGREVERRALEANGALVETKRFEFQYDLPVSTVVVRGASQYQTRTTYDEWSRAARAAETMDGQNVGSVSYQYDGARLSSVSDGSRTVNYRYDDAGRLVTTASGQDRWDARYQSGRLVPCQATFARLTSSASFWSWAWRLRQMM